MIDTTDMKTDCVAEMSTITDAQIVQTLREKSAMYAKMAEQFEKNMNPSTVASIPKTFDLSSIKDYLQKKGGRTSELSKHFGVPQSAILEIVNQPDSGIKAAERGWLKLI